ncbi:MAG: hypothetical protein HY514_00305 [Candidatus Aenigmarchaeota archaeon]|nr:hypothetical protein [Candidatus Aenigmarchaeota archaeon]
MRDRIARIVEQAEDYVKRPDCSYVELPPGESGAMLNIETHVALRRVKKQNYRMLLGLNAYIVHTRYQPTDKI